MDNELAQPFWKPFNGTRTLYQNTEEVRVYEVARASAINTHAATGFNIFNSPRFIEHMTLKMLGIEQTPHTHLVDGIDENGLRYEVKSAAINKSFRFTFSGLKPQKHADMFVLVGHSRFDLHFFVLPAFACDGTTKSVTPSRQSTNTPHAFSMEIPIGFVKLWASDLVKTFAQEIGEAKTA